MIATRALETPRHGRILRLVDVLAYAHFKSRENRFGLQSDSLGAKNCPFH
jgi:hypothetical protein